VRLWLDYGRRFARLSPVRRLGDRSGGRSKAKRQGHELPVAMLARRSAGGARASCDSLEGASFVRWRSGERPRAACLGRGVVSSVDPKDRREASPVPRSSGYRMYPAQESRCPPSAGKASCVHALVAALVTIGISRHLKVYVPDPHGCRRALTEPRGRFWLCESGRIMYTVPLTCVRSHRQRACYQENSF